MNTITLTINNRPLLVDIQAIQHLKTIKHMIDDLGIDVTSAMSIPIVLENITVTNNHMSLLNKLIHYIVTEQCYKTVLDMQTFYDLMIICYIVSYLDIEKLYSDILDVMTVRIENMTLQERIEALSLEDTFERDKHIELIQNTIKQ